MRSAETLKRLAGAIANEAATILDQPFHSRRIRCVSPQADRVSSVRTHFRDGIPQEPENSLLGELPFMAAEQRNRPNPSFRIRIAQRASQRRHGIRDINSEEV